MLMGLNGTEKAPLASTLAGRNGYEVTQGHVVFEDADLLDMEPDERASWCLPRLPVSSRDSWCYYDKLHEVGHQRQKKS